MSVEQSLEELNWFKASYSQPSTECVEIAFKVDKQGTLVRDTKDRPGGHLAVSGRSWSAFLSQVR